MKTSSCSLPRLCRLAGGTAALLTGLLCTPLASRAAQPKNPITPADSNGSQEWHSDQAPGQGGAPVPEPSTWLMMGTLVAGATYLAARSRSRTARATSL